MNVGLSLSGGGFRATVFHLGVLTRLAAQGCLEDVTVLSTVSGGSLCVGLVYACNDFHWPSSGDFAQRVLPRARELLTHQDLQSALIAHVARLPLRLFTTRSDDLARLLQQRWGVTARLSDLPSSPRWLINATCYETGRNWRFERSRMGDSAFGYTTDTAIPLSDALAASAAFPGLIGPLVLQTGSRSWFRSSDGARGALQPVQPAYAQLHLWDGGVYDNLGVESLHSFSEGWEKDVDLLVVSDGCPQPRPEPYRAWRAAERMVRGIMMNEIRYLRFRALAERFLNHGDPVAYLQIGASPQDVLRFLGMDPQGRRLAEDDGWLSEEEMDRAAQMGTHIRRLSQAEFQLLFRHGFEVADYTLHACFPATFKDVTYHSSRCTEVQPPCLEGLGPLQHQFRIPLHA